MSTSEAVADALVSYEPRAGTLLLRCIAERFRVTVGSDLTEVRRRFEMLDLPTWVSATDYGKDERAVAEAERLRQLAIDLTHLLA
jgi:hypothetical protein